MNFEINYLIDDSNAHEFAAQVADGVCSSGYIDRDYTLRPEGFYAPRFDKQQIYPRSKWPDLAKMQEDNQSSPLHIHKQADIPVLDQNGLPYCWFYGVTAGMMNRYAFSGIRPVPHLSATATAARGKNWKKEGGWGGEAIEYIEKYGVPTVDTWPEHAFDRRYLTHEMELDSQRHGIVEFEELPSQNFEALVSCLLDPINPRPVTLGLSWWQHLVIALRARFDGRAVIIDFVNSWAPTWGDGGFGTLSENKAIAFEQIAVKRVTPRMAA